MLFRKGTAVYSVNRVKDTNREHYPVSDEALWLGRLEPKVSDGPATSFFTIEKCRTDSLGEGGEQSSLYAEASSILYIKL
jgi:hypothetical protein